MSKGNQAQLLAAYGVSSVSQCAPVVISPDSGSAGDIVTLTCATSGSHIFYTSTKGDTGPDPTHSGDNAIPPTIRIGSNSGSTVAPGGMNGPGVIKALAYKLGLNDSIISQGNYAASGGGGGGF